MGRDSPVLRGLWRSTIPMTSEPQLGRRPGGKGLATDTGGFGGAPLASLATRLVIGSWNVSGWTASKLRTVLADIQADILALQETHLAAMPLQWAHGTVRDAGWHLLHGHPVPAVSGGTFGRSCGVGFVLRSGVAATAALPVGAAWRWLHFAGRLHGVRLAPRPGLPRGLLLLSVYAPLQTRQQAVQRAKFVAALLEVTTSLDLQVPTLLMGDFNGSPSPERDFLGTTSSRREACPLLAKLLGPGGAWVDLHAALLPAPLPWTFQLLDREGKLSASRIDLLLANHAAMALVRGARVLTEIRDGGHSPILAELLVSGPVSIDWKRPRAQLPELLRLSSQELRISADWAELLGRWSQSAEARLVLDEHQPHTATTLSSALAAALAHLVTLAGGWITRPTRQRRAYDSVALQRTRRLLAELYQLEQCTRDAGQASPGCWPRVWEQLHASLQRRGVVLPRSTATDLRAAVLQEIQVARSEVDRLHREMRRERYARWRAALPGLWRERPGVVYHWLQAPMAAWGCTPIVDDAGQQCLTLEAVDRAVKGYWVDQVLCQHRAVDGAERWRLFEASEFYPFVPVLQWPHGAWDGEQIGAALRTMCERSSPGLPNVPIAVWKVLPPAWLSAVARLLNLIEAAGSWPAEWLDAYIVMIPKSAGGSRPRDQRPITVLPMVYRLWSKAVVLEWQPVMQHSYLGQAAMGFRAQAGTLHVAQLLSDIITLCRTRGSELWLMSFDIEKCYDSVPWWALFGVMRRTGIAENVVSGFEAYYRQLRRRFRYGQADGDVWHAANSLMQGCPASPDELNLLLEPFHRWALASNLGVDVGVGRVPSVSFADDVALVARSQSEAETLVAAYLRWCTLLQLKVTKIQVWSNTGEQREVTVGLHRVVTVPTFKIVGVVLGADESQATAAHVAPRLAKALGTLQRLRTLELPSSICSLLWRTAVLPQALYGCEVRDVQPKQLVPLASGGKAALGPKFPIRVNAWRAPEVLLGPPMGECAVQDPVLAMRERQLRWWQVVSNVPGLVGAVHRSLAWRQGSWQEPTPALASAMRAVGWRARRNESCLRAAAWPAVEPERAYPGEILLEPVDSFAQLGAVYTDGSVSTCGGAAAVQVDEEEVRTARVTSPRSSTQCELVALALAMEFQPPQILTDSLAALHMLRSWGRWSPRRILQTPDRGLVRYVLDLAGRLASPPLLEKVKAHDESAIAAGYPKAVGNDTADRWAKRAATETGHRDGPDVTVLHGDPVILEGADGLAVWDISGTLSMAWWERRHRSTARARPLLERLYPRGVLVDWASSTGIFSRPVVQGGEFVYRVAPATIKWMARLRTGCLATRMRLVGHGMVQGPSLCLCCGEADEDEEHLLVGCSRTGAAEWRESILEAWRAVARGLPAGMPDPPDSWLEDHRFMLIAALLPADLATACGVPEVLVPRFLAPLHRALAAATAERFRRRGELQAEALAVTSTSPPEPGATPQQLANTGANPLPPERRLTVQDLRRVEQARRALPPAGDRASSSTSSVPAAGEARRCWLRQRLMALIQTEMEACPAEEGVEAVAFLELFERATGELFSDTPGTLVGGRVRGIAKVIGNLNLEGVFEPALVSVRRCAGRVWSRRPRVPGDVVAWRRQQETAELRAAPAPRLRDQMASVNAGLAEWIVGHRHLLPVSSPAAGESGMALLILWEVDHRQAFPTQGGAALTPALTGFTRRLVRQVELDSRLAWMEFADLALPLSPGLAPTHHRRWSVRVAAPAPGDPQGWYLEFSARWRAYLEVFAQPPGSRPMASVSVELQARVHPVQSRSPATTAALWPDVASRSTTTVMQPPSTAGATSPARADPRPRKRRRLGAAPPTNLAPVALAAPAAPGVPCSPPAVQSTPLTQDTPAAMQQRPAVLSQSVCRACPRQRMATAGRATVASSSAVPDTPALTRRRPREEEAVADRPMPPPKRRQLDIRGCFEPRRPDAPSASPEVPALRRQHGRATEEPPT